MYKLERRFYFKCCQWSGLVGEGISISIKHVVRKWESELRWIFYSLLLIPLSLWPLILGLIDHFKEGRTTECVFWPEIGRFDLKKSNVSPPTRQRPPGYRQKWKSVISAWHPELYILHTCLNINSFSFNPLVNHLNPWGRAFTYHLCATLEKPSLHIIIFHASAARPLIAYWSQMNWFPEWEHRNAQIIQTTYSLG